MAVNPHTEHAKMEQIITEFFAKSLHIVLESRCPFVSSRNYSGEQILLSPSSSGSSSSSMKPRDKWFNLALRDCPAALENIDFWRQSNLEPMVVDVVLVQRPVNWDYGIGSPRVGIERKERYPFGWKSDSDEFGSDGSSEKVIERWVVRYESKKGCKEGGTGSKRSSSTSSHALYKKSILLLRSLYVTVRLLPAYKIFREINSSGQIRTFNLIHRVSSSVEPLLRRDEAEMQPFMFTPVDTSCGKLCISLLYLPSISDTISESSTPMSPQFIPDYVGSPLADPLKRLPSVPVPQYSPSSSPFGRRHSWSYDTYRASPPSALPSPSPTYSESRTLHSKFGNHRPPTSSRYPSLEAAQVHTKDMGYDEYFPSPNFSPSPSPSPPMCLQGSNMSNVLLRSDSAPVYIPTSRLGDAPLSNRTVLPPFSPPLKATRPSLSSAERSPGMHQGAIATGKLLSLREEEIARPSSVKISSNSSPHKSFSRSFSRLSFEDSYDDSEFSGPFVVDDDEMMDLGSRPGSSDRSGNLGTPHDRSGPFTPRKSQDAAALLEQKKADERMLKLADDQRKQKEKLHRQIIELQKKLDDKQRLELEINHMKGKLEVMKHMSDAEKKRQSIQEDLMKKEEELEELEDLRQVLVVKERMTNDELQDARKELLSGMKEPVGRATIGVKRMGKLDQKPFIDAGKKRLASLWNNHLRDPSWHPFKVIGAGEECEEILDEEDEKIASLKIEYGEGICDAVVTALKELNEYNPSGRYPLPELWNFKENRKASMKECVDYILKQWKLCKRQKQ